MSNSEYDYHTTFASEQAVKGKTTRQPAATDNKKRKPRSSNSTPPSKKPAMESDIFGISQNRGEPAARKEDGNQHLAAYFVNRVGSGCERRTSSTEGEFYIDCKVYKTEDARSVDSNELWKKALVRIKFQANTDSPQWRALQKFVLSADSLFPEQARFYDH